MVAGPRHPALTEGELAELLDDHPALFHMAERGSWPAIARHGLLSTAALLDLYGVTGAARNAIETRRRPGGVILAAPGLPGALVRDQKPMADAALRRCLTDGMTPADWYRLLNGKVFFWLRETRLAKLLNAAPYRAGEHDVLEIRTAPLVAAYREAVTLSPINSGSTIRKAAPRGPATFRSIADYPYAARPRAERAVELTIAGGVPDIARFVAAVTRRRGSETISRIWP